MKTLGAFGFLALTSAITLAAMPAPVGAQERICVESERDGRIVCGRRVRNPYDDDVPDKGGSGRCAGSNFDENFYLAAYPDVANAVRRGQIRSACGHYERFGRFEGRLPQFSESSYLSKNPDVAEAVRRGKVRSGYDHWMRFGRYENRRL